MESKQAPDNTHIKSLVLTICAISMVFIYLVYAGNFVFGSVEGRWYYEYFKEFSPFSFSTLIISLALLALLLFAGSKLLPKHEKWVVAACLVIAVGIQILMQQTYIHSMGDLIESNISNSFYAPSIRYTPYEVLTQFSSGALNLTAHATSNLPGKILFFQLLGVFTSSPQVMGVLIVIISSLGGLLLYTITKRLFHDKQAAFYAFILYSLIPGKQFFLPILNTVTPVFILLALTLFVLYLDSKQPVWLVLLGITLYALILFEPSPMVMGVLFIGIFLYYIGQKKITKKDVVNILLLPTASFFAVYAIFDLFFTFDLFQGLVYVLKDAAGFNIEAERNYIVWIKENLKAIFFDGGLPVMMIFLYLLISIFSQWENYKKKILQWPLEHLYLLFLILTFGIVLLLGINRGETTRLWIYLAVFFQVPAAVFLAKSARSKVLFYIVAATLVIQILVTLPRVTFIAI